MKKDRIVIKVGTSTLTNELGNSNLRTMEKLAMVLSDIQNMGHEVILVSSGAIAVGANKMHLKEKPKEMRMKQAAAAVGQCTNMFLYDKFFGYYDKTVGQILLNAEDIREEEKKENLSNTFSALLEQGVIPIVNENDTVAIDELELEIGENDSLAAVVAGLVHADALVLMSDIDGLYSADPHKDANAELIPIVREITPEIEAVAGGAGTPNARGGMATKINAAKMANAAGIDMVIMNGEKPERLYDLLLAGQPVGTRFTAK